MRGLDGSTIALQLPIQRVLAFRNLYFGNDHVLVDDYSLQCYRPAHNWLRVAAALVLVVCEARSHAMVVWHSIFAPCATLHWRFLFLNTSTCFAQLFGVGVPLLLRRSMLGARSQGQRIHVSVARKVAEDHGIPEADAADALAYVSTQQRFAFLSAGFRPGYLHWHVSCPLLASHASRAGTLRAHRRPSPLIAAGSRGTCSANCFSFLWFAPAVLRGHVLSGLDLVLADACLLPPDHRFLRPRPAGWHRLHCAGPR